jgi:hypothetical protein
MLRKQREVMGAVVFVLVNLLTGMTLAGSLDPTNAPGTTMHSLEEIYQKVNAVAGKLMVVPIPKTGQVNSSQQGDDGDLEKGLALPNPRFTVGISGEATNCVVDNLSGLIWARNANMTGRMNWSNALVYCEGLTYGGYSEWRLPNINEVRSMFDYRQLDPTLSNAKGSGHWTENDPFTAVQLDHYWSSTPEASTPGYAWSLGLNVGSVDGGLTTGSNCVWPVRGGQ